MGGEILQGDIIRNKKYPVNGVSDTVLLEDFNNIEHQEKHAWILETQFFILWY